MPIEDSALVFGSIRGDSLQRAANRNVSQRNEDVATEVPQRAR